MMGRVAIVTDSIACLPQVLIEKHGIHVVAPYINYDGRVFRDGIDISTTEAYRLLRESPDLFSTSGPAPSDYVEAYRKAAAGAEAVLCITLSSKVSSTNNSALAAREQLRREMPGTPIEVVDSRTCTGAEGFVVLAAAKAVSEGKDLGGAVRAAEEMRGKVDLVFVLETIQHAYRTGRIPKFAAQVGSWLDVRPVLTWKDGSAHLKCMTRNHGKGISILLGVMQRVVGDKRVHVAVHHTDAPEEGERLKERVSGEFDCAEIWLTEFSPIMGYSTGSGALGLAFYSDE
jgi:DegV family protein with EDD domain